MPFDLDRYLYSTMFRRKLEALQFVEAENFNIDNEKQFRSAVLWLEEQKLRHLPVASRAHLRSLNSDAWCASFEDYLRHLSCPLDFKHRSACFDWLLTRAISLMYGDGLKKYQNIKISDRKSTNNSKQTAKNPLENLNYNCEEFATCVARLADILKISCHPDPRLTLQAACHVIKSKLAEKNAGEAKHKQIEGTLLELDKIPAGRVSGDPVVDDAVRVLRLLYIGDLRSLQTEINEILVAMQNLLADPRTDTRIGAIGRA